MMTVSAKKESIKRDWFIVDAKGKILGRLASKIARILMGKHKPIFTPHVDTGDHVVVINADQFRLSGQKLNSKVYYHHSGYIGGLKERPAKRLFAEKPEEMVTLAVKGMLPKTKLGRAMGKKLKVYRGETHPHRGQNPQVLD